MLFSILKMLYALDGIPSNYVTYWLTIRSFTPGYFVSCITLKVKKNYFFTIAIVLISITSCNTKNTLFKKIAAAQSGINFKNVVIENDSINPLEVEYLYNGGGVAVGDFNQDGLQDLYFTASMTANKLYLNKGNLTFKDVTEKAGVTGEGRWCNASSVVDINNDGLPDIYVCATIKKQGVQRTNLFYINQGINKEGIPTFTEMAKEYNLADTSYSVHAAFLDYDNDGDLDMYLLTTKLGQKDASRFGNESGYNKRDIDKLYQNNWNDGLQHPVFTDVSVKAGIAQTGFGLGVAISDINKDGWPDIYVTNDYFSNDALFINNKNGTFTDKASTCLKHTSENAMGNDIADINNDGLMDMIAVDMNPEDNFRKKKNMSGANYYLNQNMQRGNLSFQFVRNTLQLNRGPRLENGDSIGLPVFSEIGFMAGVAETDWSWSPLIADYDNDGHRDILITNGYPKDVTDHDFMAYRKKAEYALNKEKIIEQIPQIKVANYAYKNSGNLKFTNATKDWGLDEPSFSSGAVYADLDDDGDLDYVVNNMNEEAFLYENTVNSKAAINANYLTVQFTGDNKNFFGIGATAIIYYGDSQLQINENYPYRGYISTVAPLVYFGLDSIKLIDSLVIKWPLGKVQTIKNIVTNQLIKVAEKNAVASNLSIPLIATNVLFNNITAQAGINYLHKENDFIDFNEQRLLPHKLSQYGPGVAAGDVDGNGLDDLLIGGNTKMPLTFLLQQASGKFIEKIVADRQNNKENMGLLLLDADADGDLDLYVSNGSTEFGAGSESYQDELLVNDGKGNFIYDSTALPKNLTSKSCVKATDFDNDGDLDLFVGGRVAPGNYPSPVSSFIFRNDTKNGKIKFTDVTKNTAPKLENTGMVCDAIWTDYNNDGWMDLFVAGEWMPLTMFQNNKGKLDKTDIGLSGQTGWWNSIAGGDFDNDGDIDYLAGNLGRNSFFRAGKNEPVSIYTKDFDKNGHADIIPSIFLPDETGIKKEYPAFIRDEMVEQIPLLKKKFLTYKDFAVAGIQDLFIKEQWQGVSVLHATEFASCYVENKGDGKFVLHTLPALAQAAPLYGMVVDDFNKDGNPDILLNGNDYGNETSNGRYDALNGLLLLGNGKNDFKPQTILQSGIFIPGDGKALVKLIAADNTMLIAASQNQGLLQLFKQKNVAETIPIKPLDRYALITLKNGQKRREEFYYGSSFLSQSVRKMILPVNAVKAIVVSEKGEERIVYP